MAAAAPQAALEGGVSDGATQQALGLAEETSAAGAEAEELYALIGKVRLRGGGPKATAERQRSPQDTQMSPGSRSTRDKHGRPMQVSHVLQHTMSSDANSFATCLIPHCAGDHTTILRGHPESSG